MATKPNQAAITVYAPRQQGTGAFDGGKITEIKPIAFPGERAAVPRVGPLFYWAWATADGPARIGLHPHKGFEILSYVVEGEMGHRDTLGTHSRVAKGGAQIMQTGSGVSHEEEMLGEHTEFFQIWLEPPMNQALKTPPTYTEVPASDVPARENGGVQIRTILGGGAPMSLVTKANMSEVTLQPGALYQHTLAPGWSLAAMTVHGEGTWSHRADTAGHKVQREDFAVLQPSDGEPVELAAGPAGVQVFLVEVPEKVDYPLYPKA